MDEWIVLGIVSRMAVGTCTHALFMVGSIGILNILVFACGSRAAVCALSTFLFLF
jgi:hypothetical protein